MRGNLAASVAASGAVESATKRALAFTGSGTVTKVHVKVGTTVKKGQKLAELHPEFVCRLAELNEAANIDLHSPADRAPLSILRMEAEFGWRARFDCNESVADLSRWWMQHREGR